jgi:nicotinate phosphoribosyltransferase
VAKALEKQNKKLVGIRLDSGDMAKLSNKVRKIFDQNNLSYVKIFASGGFDEYKIKNIFENKAKIDAFGVGTSMGVSSDSPYHDTVFKLCRFNGRNVRKLSSNKKTLAGAKQVFRFFDENSLMKNDIIGTRDENFENCVKLLKPVVTKGKPADKFKSLEQARKNFSSNFKKLPDKYKAIQAEVEFSVTISENLKHIQP